MSDLHAALLEAITARKTRAEAATPGPWRAYGKYLGAEVNVRCTCYGGNTVYGHEPGCGYEPIHSGDMDERDAAFIATEAPDAVLRQCERDLKVLARHAAEPAGGKCGCADVLCSVGEHTVWPCDEIVDLAEAYAIPVDATAGQTPGGTE